MIRLLTSFLFLAFLVACASRPGMREVNVEPELRKSSEAFTERHPESAGPVNGYAASGISTESASLPKPSIMVLPAGTKNLNESVDLLNHDPIARAAATAIQGYLMDKRYSLKSIEGSSLVNEAVSLQNEISGEDEDLSYLASLSFGADIYIKFTVDVHRGQILANLSAYESTSGRMLGTQTATVNDNGTRLEELVASAAHKALPGLEKKILAYFAEDSRIGVPYKVIFKTGGEDETSILGRLPQLLKSRFEKVTVNAMTDKTADLTVYAKASECSDVYALYDAIQQVLGSSAIVQKKNLVQKLLILELD